MASIRDVPSDALRVVFDFLPIHPALLVCRRFAELIHLRTIYSKDRVPTPDEMEQFADREARTLSLSLRLTREPSIRLDRLGEITSLNSVSLYLTAPGVDSSTMASLSSIRSLHNLRALKVHVKSRVMDAERSLLTAIPHLSFLNSLSLGLSYNGLDGDSVRSLFQDIGTLRHLVKLDLNISGSSLVGGRTPSAFDTLEGVSRLKSLHYVTLKLNACGLTDTDVAYVSKLDQAPLKKLALHLYYNHITREGCEALASLVQVRGLERLVLDLEANTIGEHGVAAIVDRVEKSPLVMKLCIARTGCRRPARDFNLPIALEVVTDML
eukprot:NODE_2674_length_1144_cov_26.770776_g2452_i0.p1 GENE.NODE_2674_length_1144_cov_26.770776_g2452_i0~~NODE_2674_length_1144_cov_26.770776_g2452_i0.p1  ORF type:complete len:344 (-),score=53.97 NODE_2674_length_1144_cov_26.770776_g2452_i0:111-1082(-)